MTIFSNFKSGILKFVKNHDFPIFSCFQYSLYLYLRSVFIHNELLQTLHIGYETRQIVVTMRPTFIILQHNIIFTLHKHLILHLHDFLYEF